MLIGHRKGHQSVIFYILISSSSVSIVDKTPSDKIAIYIRMSLAGSRSFSILPKA
jgi:hypothetical protein